MIEGAGGGRPRTLSEHCRGTLGQSIEPPQMLTFAPYVAGIGSSNPLHDPASDRAVKKKKYNT